MISALKDSESKLIKYREKMSILQKELSHNQSELIECEKNNEELSKFVLSSLSSIIIQ